MLKDKLKSVPVEEKTEVEQKTTEDGIAIHSTSTRLKTIDDVINHLQVDTRLWEIDRVVANSWESGSKGPGGKVLVTPLFEIKMWLKRKAPEIIQSGIMDLIASWKPPKVASRKYNKGNCLAEVSLYDAHFGSLAFGNASYELADARNIFVQSVQDLTQHLLYRDVDRIVLPIGNDFFHVDNWKNETFGGTKLDHIQQDFPKIFTEGWKAVDEVIMILLEHAPVEVLWVPGNHDRSTSFYLVELLRARHQKTKNVTFDVENITRKYRIFGNNLFGYTHGDKVRINNLPLVMAAEVPDLWGSTKYRAWRCGHFHTKKQLSFYVGDTTHGVKVEVMPSLCPTNEWHHENGYIGNTRSAEMWLWDKDSGYKGHFAESIQ